MINDARSYASLSSGLLARKGAAKPAMRPQGFGHHAGFDDLGWNDMGSHGHHQEPAPEDVFEGDLPEHVPSSIAALTPSPKPAKAAPTDAEEHAEPEVVAQQRAIAESFPAEAEAEEEALPPPPAVVPLRKRQAVPAPVESVGGRKAAFTLRLDANRHLRLRLATAVTGRSAQQIVTGALDALLATIPELEALAERVPPATAKRS